jgi:hypothetical protein
MYDKPLFVPVLMSGVKDRVGMGSEIPTGVLVTAGVLFSVDSA